MDSGGTAMPRSRRASVRGAKPASIRTRVLPASTSSAFPLLPLPRTESLIRRRRPSVDQPQVAIVGAPLVRRFELRPGARGQPDRPPRHLALGDLEELVDGKRLVWRAIAPSKRV